MGMGKRALLGVALALACGLPAGASAAAAAPPTTQLTGPVCHHALFPAQRKVAITAVMRPVSGTSSMAMMFDLQRASRRWGPFASVRGAGLDQWVRPANPTLGQRPGDIWKFDQKVENLPGPAYYRFRVRFRWTGARGRSLRTSSTNGPVCFQPELRPDLQARSLTIKPPAGAGSQTSSGQAAPTPQYRYIGVIANRGLTSAGPFEVELIEPGTSSQTATVNGLGSHATIRETFTAPPCTPGSQITLIVDPNGAVLDYNHANNTLSVPCPAAP